MAFQKIQAAIESNSEMAFCFSKNALAKMKIVV